MLLKGLPQMQNLIRTVSIVKYKSSTLMLINASPACNFNSREQQSWKFASLVRIIDNLLWGKYFVSIIKCCLKKTRYDAIPSECMNLEQMTRKKSCVLCLIFCQGFHSTSQFSLSYISWVSEWNLLQSFVFQDLKNLNLKFLCLCFRLKENKQVVGSPDFHRVGLCLLRRWGNVWWFGTKILWNEILN